MTPKELGEHIDITAARKLVHGFHIFLILVVLAAIFSSAFTPSVFAVPIGSRSLSISTPSAGAVSSHVFSLTLNSATAVGSESFEYCQESPIFGDTCTSPLGLSLSSVALSAQTGETGYSVHPSSTVNKIILTRAPSVVVPGVSTYTLSGVINPSQANTSAFVRVATYASNNATGNTIDEGGLAFSITNPLNVQASIQSTLTLCTGITVEVDCTSTLGTSIDFGELSTNSTRSVTSQFSIASQDGTGYNAYVLGGTMTSGINQIPAINTQSVSTKGYGQFGLNLVENTNPAIGKEKFGPGFGEVSPSYDDTDLFKFTSGDVVASSNVPTGFNRYTLAYIVNVAASQAEGVYSTTITILGVANY